MGEGQGDRGQALGGQDSVQQPGSGLVVALCGMHRSGTSMFARYLHDSGIDMGERLYEDRRTNPHGHYEDMDFLTLQRTELARCFDGEDYLVAKSFEVEPAFREAAKALARERCSAFGERAWGWKDPRTTLFLDLWLELLPGLQVVAMLREPRAVLDSLCRRTRAYFSVSRKNHLLRTYTHYNQALLDFAGRHPERVHLVPLEPLLEEPGAVLGRLSEGLGLALDVGVFEERFDPSAMSHSRRAGVLFNGLALREAEAVRAALMRQLG